MCIRDRCAEIPREEAIGTFETEYELFLNESGKHEIVIDWESRPGVGEIGADGRAAGSFELSDACLLYTSPSPRDRTRYRMPSSA